jgi:DNA replication licensing factor MCM5
MTKGVQFQSRFGEHFPPPCDYHLLNWSLYSQLEAIIRISESLAKMILSPVVKNHHVEEAIRLFKFSTMDAVSAGSADGLSRGELNEEMTRIERELLRRLPVGWSTSYQSLVKEFVTQQGFSSHALERTLFILEKKETIRFSGQVCSFLLLCMGLC